MPLPAGTRLGPYELTAEIGVGGMGQVYKAIDTRLERTVAIKILPSLMAYDREFRERFDREAKTISALNHPNICTLYDVGEAIAGADSVRYLVMEYLEGESVAARLSRRPRSLSRANSREDTTTSP
jgi:serine/threonine protein kinase